MSEPTDNLSASDLLSLTASVSEPSPPRTVFAVTVGSRALYGYSQSSDRGTYSSRRVAVLVACAALTDPNVSSVTIEERVAPNV